MQKEIQVLFKPEMVNALSAGIKIQTRRLVTPQQPKGYMLARDPASPSGFAYVSDPYEDILLKCRYGKAGDRLWVRETTEEDIIGSVSLSRYKADHEPVLYPEDGSDYAGTWVHWTYPKSTRPSIFMPRWASRFTLEVVSVRIERLHDITAEDAIAEGLTKISKDGGVVWKYGIPDRDGLPGNDNLGWPWVEWCVDPIEAYRKIWESINGAGSWDANPLVWVIEFKDVTVKRVLSDDKNNKAVRSLGMVGVV